MPATSRYGALLPAVILATLATGGSLPAQSGCAATWNQGESFPLAGTNGPIFSAVEFDDGSGPALYCAGNFTIAGGVLANGLARLRNGVFSPVATPIPAGGINSLAVFDDGTGPALHAAGSINGPGSMAFFQKLTPAGWISLPPVPSSVYPTLRSVSLGGHPALFALSTVIYQWTSNGWSALPMNPGIWQPVDIAVFGDLYVAGAVTGTTGASAVMRWNGQAWSIPGGGLTGTALTFARATSLLIHDFGSGPRLVAGGSFRFAGGVPAPGLAVFDGMTWSAPFPELPNTTISNATERRLIARPGTGTQDLYLATYNASANTLARWSGQAWEVQDVATSFHPRGTTTINLGGGQADILAFGDWEERDLGHLPGRNLAQLTSAGWRPACPGLAAEVHSATTWHDAQGPAIVACGAFRYADGQPVDGVALRRGGTWHPLGSGPSSAVGLPMRAILGVAEFDDGTGRALYAIGRFSASPTMEEIHVTRWNRSTWSPVGGALPVLTAPYSAPILGFDDGSGPALYVGCVGGAGILRWRGGAWEPVGGGLSAPSPEGLVVSSIIPDAASRVLTIGGTFDHASTIPLIGAARWNGSAWSAMGGGIFGPVTGLAQHDDGFGPRVMAAGFVTTPDGPGAGLLRFEGSLWTAVPVPAVPGPTPSNQVLARIVSLPSAAGPRLLGTGFMAFASTALDAVVSWDGTSWSGLGFGVGPSTAGIAQSDLYRVQEIVAVEDPAGVRVACCGRFELVGGVPSSGFALWSPGGAPAARPEPVDTSVLIGDSVRFQVSPIGTAPFSFQWRHDGQPIAGAQSSTLTLPAVHATDAGTYDVVIGNACGATPVSPRHLRVASRLTIDQPGGSRSIRIGVDHGEPGAPYFTALTLDSRNTTSPGDGFWCGLFIPYPELLAEVMTLAPPFVGSLDSSGQASLSLPGGTLAPVLIGQRLFGVNVLLDAQTQIAAPSSIASLVLN